MKKLLLLAFLSLCCAGSVHAQMGGVGPMVPNTPPGVQANLTATTSPTTTDDQTKGYQVGSLWQNANTGQVWIARSVTTNAAVWTNLDLTDFGNYVAANWYIPEGIQFVNAGSAPGSGSIRLFPGIIKQRVTLNALGVRVTTLSAAGNVQAAIYANNPTTMRPTGNALASTASMTTGSVASVNSAVSVQLEPGIYWFATNCDNGTAIFTSPANGTTFGGILFGTTAQSDLQGSLSLIGLSVAQAFGSWPDLTSASFTDVITNAIPIVQIKVASVP